MRGYHLYPWGEWFRKEWFILRHGIHYQCRQTAMIQQIRNAAVKHGVKVSIREIDQGFRVTVRRNTKAPAPVQACLLS